MLKLEDIRAGALVEGLLPGRPVTVIATIWHGDHDVEIVFQDPDRRLDRALVSRDDEERLSVAAVEESWPLDGDGRLFKLASEARRIKSAHLFDPYVAVEAADIDPLPHQIEAVYHRMMPIQPLRFVLADDPGAGKTIMSGLYIRELAIRGDVERVLVVAPGSLVVQWQDELSQRFHLDLELGNLTSLTWLRLALNQGLAGCVPVGLKDVPDNDLAWVGLLFCDGTPPVWNCDFGGAVSDAASNPGLVSDCEALLESKDALRGDEELDWSDYVPMSQWQGVTVSGAPARVTGLILGNGQVSGTIPPDLGRLSSLEVLTLYNNQLSRRDTR